MDNALTRLKARHLAGQTGGLFAVCSAHPTVLGCAMEMVRANERPLLVEATANQVNPFGGYSGRTPAQFMAYVGELAQQAGLPLGRILVGADHLGPHVWKAESARAAMQKAETLARQCVAAGFHKLHLDTGTGCADDPAAQLPVAEAARRAARLCRAAEAVRSDREDGPLYVIGKEVPPPGGALEAGETPTVSDPAQILADLAVYRQAFEAAGVGAAWSRVMAVVVQPGVDFGDHGAAAYQPERAAALSAAHGQLPGSMTYEIHATDYQTPAALQRMVQDHFPLLKVGPCLTFALRRALYALAEIEAQLGGIVAPSRLPQVMEDLMTEQPQHWRSHYKGDEARLRHLRHHSPRDRIRYYWSDPRAAQAVARLMHNLRRPLPAALLEAKLPEIYAEICQEKIFADPSAIARCAVHRALRPYAAACR
ncbi:MAG: class II D-tagatose-bisphosphate aldolase, non-catalytic subunit [Desulfatitalea sp.]|nr:class II D-tagatose-bisphosphate aldolase, non-catalytic subunit [Desulfatitalea sp.]